MPEDPPKPAQPEGMRCAIDFYEVVMPFKSGSYDQLLCRSPLPGEEPPRVWSGCLRDWLLHKLRASPHEFGMFYAEIVPIDDQDLVDDEAMDRLIEQNGAPLQAEVLWSGSEELLPAAAVDGG